MRDFYSLIVFVSYGNVIVTLDYPLSKRLVTVIAFTV